MTSYVADLAAEADALGVQLGEPSWNDDDWDAKVAALLAHPPAVVSFTFGCPSRDIVAALHAAGSAVWVTITEPGEAVEPGEVPALDRLRRALGLQPGEGRDVAIRAVSHPDSTSAVWVRAGRDATGAAGRVPSPAPA